jgi:hypothetical protein
MLSPDLENFQPISATKNAIVANARNNFIDAYASALSLDGAITPQDAPVRFALLNLNGDTKFDEADVEQFLRHLYTVDGDPNTGTQQHPCPSPLPAQICKVQRKWVVRPIRST